MRDFITIVSGLPRSGTSMMMQAVEAGGIPALTDKLRAADVDNPRGYYEFEPVKKTQEDPSWLGDAPGKVVKMVYRLLYDLPPGREYRVVFMQRKLDEVLASQDKMLQRLGQAGGGADHEKMAELFRQELDKFYAWIEKRESFRVLYVKYHEMIAAPAHQARRINEFLGGDLDEDAMAAAVDPDLYRNRR